MPVNPIDPGSGRRECSPQIDLSAYCARIDYRGALTPSLSTLRALQELHQSTILKLDTQSKLCTATVRIRQLIDRPAEINRLNVGIRVGPDHRALVSSRLR